MTLQDEFKRLNAVFEIILLSFTFQGAHCQLTVSPAGPALRTAAAGSDVTLDVSFSGAPDPAVTWFMGDFPVVTWTINSPSPADIDENRRDVLRILPNGSLKFVNVSLDYTSNYTIEITKSGLGTASTTLTLVVFEKPPGSPMCSVQSVNNTNLQYRCWWPGGTPLAQLSFPELNSSSGVENFDVAVTPSDDLNGKAVQCVAEHPTGQSQCSVIASGPVKFLPAVRNAVDSDGKIVVTVHCFSEASPEALVSWSKGGEAIANGTTYQISSDTTQLKIHHFNVSHFLLQNYTCTCHNPLGSQTRDTQLRGPSISNSSVFPNQSGTIITLTWEVPPTSVVTGFDIQMEGPDLQTKGSSKGFRTIQQKPGSARSTDIFPLNPDVMYRFRVIPKARFTAGEPSEVHVIRPDGGLSGPAIAGIAAGIPCSLLFLVLLVGFIYLCVYCNKNKSRQTRYPVSRAVEKAITTQTETTPHNLLTGGLKSPPDYNRLHQTPSERSVALPTFVPPPPVRVATTV